MDPYILYAATIAFLATHFISSTPLRPLLAQAIGERGYIVAYSLLAFATLGWMIWAFKRAPVEPLWPGLRLAPAVLMPFSFILFACGLFSRNPTAVGQAKAMASAEPARGIIRVTRHPMMWSFMLWALAHVLARGELKATVFFGAFLLLAALGAVLIDRRKEKTLGEDWKRFAAATSYFPFLAIAQGRNRLDLKEIGWRNPLIGLLLYGLVLWFHAALFGLRPY
ncbi:MAG: NnrU family protein [Burkholderiales bacterium]|nr:NnrU family protein [Burkholderiales bacterium]